MNKLNHTNTIKNDRFPSSLFLVYFLVLLLMSGIHTGIIVGMNALGMEQNHTGDFTAWLLDCCGSWIDTFYEKCDPEKL